MCSKIPVCAIVPAQPSAIPTSVGSEVSSGSPEAARSALTVDWKQDSLADAARAAAGPETTSNSTAAPAAVNAAAARARVAIESSSGFPGDLQLALKVQNFASLGCPRFAS